ncbi:MAG: phage holin family protein [Clostridia bacterium]|nr:phage holin family protein [Clostridia bacterium]
MVLATIFGYVSKFLGGFDSLLITLIILIVVDYVTGVIAAIYEKKLSSSIGYKGIIKKVLMVLIVGVAVTLQRIMPEGVPLREITILFFIANEGLSVFENAAKVIPMPQKLKSVLLQLKEKENKDK